MKNVFVGRLNTDKERISELGQKKSPKLKHKEEKRMGEKKEQNIQELWYHIQ